MGLIRTLLALAVVEFHSVAAYGNAEVWMLPNGVIAVQCFYIVSGFYMSLVLSQKYNGQIAEFYRARVSRLIPLYWIVLAATVLALSVTKSPFLPSVQKFITEHPLWGVWIIFSNATLIGQDINCFLWVDGVKLSTYNFVNQAWTVGVELMFYAIAPFLVALRLRWIVLMFVASVAARYATYSLGYFEDPWNYRFFPFEIAWFLMGMMAYRFFEMASAVNAVWLRRVGWPVFLGILGVLLSYKYCLPIAPPVLWGQIGYQTQIAVAVCVSLPFVFAVTRHSKIDAFIGEFSYPIYMCHIFVMQFLVDQRLPSSGIRNWIVSIALAAALILFVRPIESWRERRLVVLER